MNIKPSAWMKELPTEEGVERAVRTTTVKEVADDWEQAIPLYTDDDLRSAVLAEREACAKVCEEEQVYFTAIPCPDGISGCLVAHHGPVKRKKTATECAAAIRARGEE
jgi:hypothetical protein